MHVLASTAVLPVESTVLHVLNYSRTNFSTWKYSSYYYVQNLVLESTWKNSAPIYTVKVARCDMAKKAGSSISDKGRIQQ